MLRLKRALVRRRRLLVAPWAALAADATITLLLQSPEYWSGQYETASEGEVIGAMMLRLHPLAFVAWIAVWALALAIVILFVPQIIARIICVGAALLHTFGLLQWLLMQSSNPYFAYSCGLVCAALIVYSLERKDAETEARPKYTSSGSPDGGSTAEQRREGE
jgi:hypothetical protein